MKTNPSFNKFSRSATRITFQRGLVFGLILLLALLAFEIFNFSTTEFALKDLLGEFSFLGIYWSTILAIAFCGIDFAGIARLFTPEQGKDEPKEVWYLFGAWLLAATMNAMLTWWGISIAILNDDTLGAPVIDRPILLRVVPIFVALLVWLIRVLIIGTFSVAGGRLFSSDSLQANAASGSPGRIISTPASRNNPQPISAAGAPTTSFRPAPKPTPASAANPRQEPLYTTFDGAAPQNYPSRGQAHEPINAAPGKTAGQEQHFS